MSTKKAWLILVGFVLALNACATIPKEKPNQNGRHGYPYDSEEDRVRRTFGN